ncbi:hypothetical protein [Rhodobacter sp. 24-YEA-8]|uniref:hypothetical protein n=1 Tax=Rhodobacter sp. 24-YEA-8 TaxID=1884310 RepID=UPI000899D5DD|nr:hypothetical protein [Rhodobacter sp. 24-YEA-8]SEC12177.1 hypothetical protein SAMN05519105_1991 [Rhodobacter sp. 24-YEA-8]
MDDRDRIGEEIARSRQDLAEAIAALRQNFNITRFFGGGQGRASGPDVSGHSGPAQPGAAVMPVIEAAGAAIRANPRAAALAGAGLAWLAWSGVRRRATSSPEARPEWLDGIAALREEADRLRARVERSRDSGALDDVAARDSLEDIAASLDHAIRHEIGRGLDGLDAETRTAALAAREAACRREFGKDGAGASGHIGATLGRVGKIVTAGAALTAAGGFVASLLSRGQPSAAAAAGGRDEAGMEDTEAREELREDLEQLSLLVARLTSTLRSVVDETVSRDESSATGRDETPADAALREKNAGAA